MSYIKIRLLGIVQDSVPGVSLLSGNRNICNFVIKAIAVIYNSLEVMFSSVLGVRGV